MKIHNITKWMIGAAMLFSMTGCTSNFDEINSENAVTPESALADYGIIVSLMKTMQNTFKSDTQLYPNLSADMYSGMFSTATQFNGGKNNMTYFMMDGWNNRIVQHQVEIFNTSINIDTAIRKNYSDLDFTGFKAVKKILRVMAAMKVADSHGPVAYSKFETPNSNGVTDFDSQEDAYNYFIADLTAAINDLQKIGTSAPSVNASDKAVLKLSDKVYKGDMLKWAKLANSLKLRFAMRMSYADPAKSRKYAEEALISSAGLIDSNADNALMSIGENEMNFIVYSWGDCLVGAPLVTYLQGYFDPRLSAYVKPATDQSIEGEYKGIRTGIDLINGKTTYGGFSQPIAKSATGDYFSGTDGKLKLFTAAETWFLKSEAALRGYSGAGDAKTNYETGVAQSFGEWGKDGVAAYLNDSVSTQEPYIDPKNPANNVLEGDSQLSTITIKWNNADSNERKLERIITQKWLSLYPNGPEAWAEQRRTGYPILFKVRQNDSGGTIDTNAMVRRIPFTNDTKTSTLNYPQAASMLNGPDTGGTRLWWDKK
ncbi:Susd and RagB outer membrane lipoprotein [Soonwooa buanensis]|uniref:Susd and RagB outer membrane lipoprotein n=1 Tax=Soonwooa buanensis TaxID=619805 RepID=A0A1T5D1U3_9FLAO|nr:SusD/RagB family nutrient-binding outer membrane lipoprotein [Soonwooa buanensis]SKB65695.1 Susd and RagB outer membrane lipoprotein [Soonwooa buanensis]